MNFKELILLLIAILASTGGQFFLKLGALKLAKISSNSIFDRILNIAFTPELILGLTCYGLGAVFYILLLTRVNLSVASPAVSLIYVFSVLLGYFFFKEDIPLSRAIGLGLIVCGVILVIWKR
ncbi:MAG: EamA family transporter [Prochloraceae cyanobacterium]